MPDDEDELRDEVPLALDREKKECPEDPCPPDEDPEDRQLVFAAPVETDALGALCGLQSVRGESA
jgi:hypothetical protein